MDKKEELKYAQTAMQWYGWGSPIGLGLFLVLLALVALITTIAINNLTDKNVTMEAQNTRMEQSAR